MTDGGTEAAQPRPRMTKAILVRVLGLAIAFAITAVDSLLLTLNLSTVSRRLHVPPNIMGYLGGAATLVVAAAVLLVGNLGDKFGLKRLLMYGLIANIVAELLAALSPNYAFLLMMRFLDGFALTALLGLSLALLTVAVPPEIRPAALGIFMATDTIIYGVAPLVGGWMVETIGWRSVFLLVPPLSLVALGLTARYVVEPPRAPGRRLDVLGVSLFGIALLALVYGVGAAQNGLGRPQAWAPLVLSAVAFASFVRHERRVRQPALDMALFTRPAFVLAVLAVMTLNFLAAGFGVILGQFGSVILALSAKTIGLLYLPGTLVIAAASILAGRLVARYTARPVLITGLLILLSSGLVMAISAAPAMALWVLVLATWLSSLGCFMTTTPASDVILSHAPPENAGAVTAVQPAFGMTGYALGPTIYILLLNIFFQREWLADAASRALSAQQAKHAVDAVTSSMSNSPGNTRYDPALVQQAAGLALNLDYTKAVRLTMLTVSLLPLTVAVLAYFLMRWRSFPRRRLR